MSSQTQTNQEVTNFTEGVIIREKKASGPEGLEEYQRLLIPEFLNLKRSLSQKRRIIFYVAPVPS